MYKDKDKQREAQRNWVRQKRASKQGSTQSSTKRGHDIKSFEDLPPDVQFTINRLSMDVNGKIDWTSKANRTSIAISYQHMFPDRYDSKGIHISDCIITGKPGDADYNGICTEEWRAERGR